MSSSIMVPVVVTLMVLVLQTRSAEVVQIIRAQLGTDIILPCRYITQKTLIGVQWTRPDLNPDLVFLHEETHNCEHYQNPCFKGRVEMLDIKLRNGNASLILRHVSSNDSGIYECRVQCKDGSRSNIKGSPIYIITLNVTDSGDTDDNKKVDGNSGKCVGLIALCVVVPLVVVVVVVVLAVLYLKRQRTHSSVPTNSEEDN